MDWKIFTTVFGAVFIAEMGDKTQLATLLFAARADTDLVAVFAAAASALVLTTAIGVFGGAVAASYLNPRVLAYLAGTGFIFIGAWTIWQA